MKSQFINGMVPHLIDGELKNHQNISYLKQGFNKSSPYVASIERVSIFIKTFLGRLHKLKKGKYIAEGYIKEEFNLRIISRRYIRNRMNNRRRERKRKYSQYIDQVNISRIPAREMLQIRKNTHNSEGRLSKQSQHGNNIICEVVERSEFDNYYLDSKQRAFTQIS